MSTIIIRQFKPMERTTLRGFAVVEFPSGLVINDVTVHTSNGKPWASPPSKPMVGRDGIALKDANGKARYQPVIEFKDKETRAHWSKRGNRGDALGAPGGGAMSAADWRTRFDPADTARYGCQELHGVFFVPTDDGGGIGNAVGLQVPEASRQQVSAALRIARQTKARFFAVCDTREQADRIATRAARLLPDHRRVPYERAEAGMWGRRCCSDCRRSPHGRLLVSCRESGWPRRRRSRAH
jgi:hypothetical protein